MGIDGKVLRGCASREIESFHEYSLSLSLYTHTQTHTQRNSLKARQTSRRKSMDCIESAEVTWSLNAVSKKKGGKRKEEGDKKELKKKKKETIS